MLGLRRLKAEQERRRLRPPAARARGADEYELAIDFEINRPDAEGGRYRRPFVAIWVEDKDGIVVRNVALGLDGGPGPWEWMKDLNAGT